MGLFHRHVWQVAVKTYAPPTPDLFKGATISTYLAERVSWGVTTVLVTCACGATRTVEMLGREVTT